MDLIHNDIKFSPEINKIFYECQEVDGAKEKAGVGMKLWVVGRGDEGYVASLKKLASAIGVDKRISWFGFVEEDRKFELLGRAHVLVAPSVKEGWGLTVPEAAFVGTPSVVYDSPGLRDVLKGSLFKKLVKINSPESLADETVSILKDKVFYKKLEDQKLDRRAFEWDYTAEQALEVFNK